MADYKILKMTDTKEPLNRVRRLVRVEVGGNPKTYELWMTEELAADKKLAAEYTETRIKQRINSIEITRREKELNNGNLG